MQTHEIRRRFLGYFEKTGHTVVPSRLADQSRTRRCCSPIAGMVPFKPYFLGQATPPFPRATSVQKCVRTLDIERSARPPGTTRSSRWPATSPSATTSRKAPSSTPGTLLTGSLDDGGFGLDPDRLWVTVYDDDDEAARLWQQVAGLPAERIQRRGMADNFWSMGVPGPVRPVLGDLLRPRPRVRHRGRPGRRRGPLPGDLEPGLHAGHARRAAVADEGRLPDPRRRCRSRTSTPAWASSGSRSSCRASTTSTRPTSPPDHRPDGGAVRARRYGARAQPTTSGCG